MNNLDYNLATIFSCLFVLIGYTILSITISIFYPNSSFKTQLSKTTANSFLWAKKHKERTDAASVTLAIQTLRNTILIAVFVGGTTLQTAINLILSYDTLDHLMARIRTIILSSLLFLSFLSWANVIRSASHLGYIVGIVSYEIKPSLGSTSATTSNSNATISIDPILNKVSSEINLTLPKDNSIMNNISIPNIDDLSAQEESILSVMFISFSLGFKFQFIAIPFFLYIVGPEALIISTVVMIFFLYLWERVYAIQQYHVSTANKSK